MNVETFLLKLLTAEKASEVEELVADFEGSNEDIDWRPVGGRANNRGVIEVSADPGRALVERVTNGIDGVLEAEYVAHSGRPVCKSPREAAQAWLNVPDSGISEMTQRERQQLADRIVVTLSEGDGRQQRTVEVTDKGIGILPNQITSTILSLNESNKVTKHYLAGTYGQGGSATFATSRFTLIASRHQDGDPVGFTLVKYLDLPAETYKTGHYVYLASAGEILDAKVPIGDFARGTKCKHFGYDLSKYGSPLGPGSVYGLLQRVLFDPVMPIWLHSKIHKYRRVIKGARNALNGAVDEGDEGKGPTLSLHQRMFYVSIDDFGRIGIEYWVLPQPEKGGQKPTASFVDPRLPIVFTLNGQNQAEVSHLLIKRQAELPYIANRMILHVDCNSISPQGLRQLFVSNREDVRSGVVFERIQEEIIRALKSDED